MNGHIDEFIKIILGLESLEVEMDDDDKTILLINSLTESHEYFSTTCCFMGMKKLLMME